MISGLDLNATIDYTLKNDIEPKTIFKLGIIPSYIFSRLIDGKDDIDRVYKILQVGIKGWENFEGVPFETIKEKISGNEVDVIPMSILNKFSIKTISELSMKIMEINSIKDDERKN